jgi:molybdopterin-guanine dinucleotide biosynthesis protein A
VVRGAILAGGAARRYGGLPKGLEKIGETRILDLVVERVASASGDLPLLITNDPQGASWRTDLRVIPDVRPGCGSLGGIYTAVLADSGPVLCVAWDMPFVTTELLSALIAGSTGYDVFLPESAGPQRVEPLCAVYGPGCANPIERRLARGSLKATAFHSDVKVGTLSLDRVRRFGSPEMLFFNVNRPQDLQRAARLSGR